MKKTRDDGPAPEPTPTRQPAATREPAATFVAPLTLQAGDFYLEGGRMVFTAAYHLRRGYCCGNQCRHCPYRDWKQ
jgi:hypothetical protein